MNPLRFCFLNASVTLSAPFSMAEETKTVLKIQDEVIGSISPQVFGQFLDRPSWGGETGPEAVVEDSGRLPSNVLEMMASLRPTVMRFPGGSDVDHMNWTDMISHAPDRTNPDRPISIGKDGDEVTNRFGFDEFFVLQEQLGFEVVLVGNLRQALYKERPLDEAALHEAGLLAYARSHPGAELPEGMPAWGDIRVRNGRPDPVPVRYFMVGNEAQFFWPPKQAETLTELGLADQEEAWEWFRECLIAYGKALKAVDPQVELILDGFHDPFNPDNDEANAARRAIYLHSEIRALYNHLGAHHYAPLGFYTARLKGEPTKHADFSDEQIWYGLVSAPGLHDETGQNVAVGSHYDEMIAAGYRISFTEWNFNAWSEERVLQDRPFLLQVPARLATAGFLHGILRHGDNVSLATQSMILGTQWGITAIRADASGEQPPYWFPQGQVALFYRHRTGRELISSELLNAPSFRNPAQLTPWWPAVDEVSLLDVLVTRNDEQLFVHAINRSPDKDLPLRIELPESYRPTTSHHAILTSEPGEPFERQDVLPIEILQTSTSSTNTSVLLPRHSLSIIEIRSSRAND